jgi:hypothetical protein
MAAFIGIRSFLNLNVAFVQNQKRLRFDRTARKSTFFWALGASFSILAVALALPAGAQSAATDASAVAGSASTANIVRWTGSMPEAAGRMVEMSFALYQDPAGEVALWNETQTVKVGADGRYSVLLGATSAEGLPQALFQAGEAQWIEARPIEAQLIAASGGDAVAEVANATSPARSLLAAVPYAFKSMDAETLAGRPADDYVTHEDLKSTVADQVQATQTVGLPLPIGGAPKAPGTGTAGLLPVWTTPSTLGNSLIAQSGANVGIGTIAPATMLDVNGASTLRAAVSLLASAATLAAGTNSPALQLGASTYSSASHAAVPQNFAWQAASSGNNTASPAANLALLFGSGTTPPTATGLSIAPNGQITFAPGQTFPGETTSPGTGPTTSTLTGVTAGPGLTGGGSSGNVTLSLSMPIPPANGGTGATTPSGALANLTSAVWVDGVAYPRTAAGIQQAINDAPLGGTVFLPTGVYTYGPSDTCITVTKPVNIQGMGTGSVIQVASSVSASNDIFCVSPAIQANFIRFSDFSILPQSTSKTPARYGFNINGVTAMVYYLSIERVNIPYPLGSYAIYAQDTGLVPGVPVLSDISHNILAGGIAMTNCGDTVRVVDNVLWLAGKIDVSFQPGASSFIFTGNNVTVPGGMHIGTSAIGSHIENNEFETSKIFTGSNGSIVDIDGSSGSTVHAARSITIEHNSFQVVNGITANGIRINNADNTDISGNSFERGATTSVDILITGKATNTIVGANMWLSGPPYSSMVSNSGTGTSFLTQYGSLNNVASAGAATSGNTASSISERPGVTTPSGSTSTVNGTTLSGLVNVSGSGCRLTDITGNSLAGSIRSGTNGVCTLTITPGVTAAHGFTCFVNDETTANVFRQTAHTATNATLTGATVSGDVLTFGCQPF